MGAPTADSRQPQVTKGGAVYKCPPDAPGSCEMIPFDTKGKRQFRKCSREVLYFLDFSPEMHFLKVQKKLDLRNTARCEANLVDGGGIKILISAIQSQRA